LIEPLDEAIVSMQARGTESVEAYSRIVNA
jgi:hypothetical protein